MKTVSKLIDDIAGYLILGGLGAFFGSLALPEEWARHACLAGVTLLIAGLGLDAVLDTQVLEPSRFEIAHSPSLQRSRTR
ncbi:hypothetical protein EBR25_13100 [bacterium]|nr:hypothetical protein [bacterium]